MVLKDAILIVTSQSHPQCWRCFRPFDLVSIAVADNADQAAASPRPLPSSLSWINYEWITLKIQSVDARVFDHYRLWDYADCLWRNGLRLPAWVLRFR